MKFSSPSDARRHGIVAIFQELMIVPELSVAENVLLGNEPGPAGFLYSRHEAERRTAAVLRSLGDRLDINPRRRAGSLSTAQKQIVEIARALVLKPPLSSWTSRRRRYRETRRPRFLTSFGSFAPAARPILFVSHRLDEVRSIADRITVLRGGERIATLEADAIADPDDLIELMVGRPIDELFPPATRRSATSHWSCRI